MEKFYKDPDGVIHSVSDKLKHKLPTGSVEISKEEALKRAAETTKLTYSDAVVRYRMLVDSYLDNFARANGYKHIEDVCSFVTSSNAQYKREADYCIAIRDKVWVAFDAAIANAKGDVAKVPTTTEGLPKLEWPKQ